MCSSPEGIAAMEAARMAKLAGAENVFKGCTTVTSVGVIATHVVRSDGAEGWGFSWSPQIGAPAVHALLEMKKSVSVRPGHLEDHFLVAAHFARALAHHLGAPDQVRARQRALHERIVQVRVRVDVPVK